VLFFDAGNVWNEPWRLRPGDLLYDAGTGLRYPSPFGLVGVDAGYQLTPRAAPRLTGNGTDRRWRIHFTLGQSF
jgi:outer membrane translocation and assembly module TamA